MKRHRKSSSSLLYYAITCIGFFLLTSCKKDPKILFDANLCSAENTKHDTVVLLVMGQSNAANAGNELYTSPCPNAENFYNGALFPLADPLKGSNGEGGSVWSRLGEMLIKNGFAKHVIIAPAAVGGTRIEQWVAGGDLHHLIVEAITSLKTKNLKVTHVLWHQGESNNSVFNEQITPTQNAESYRQNFLSLVNQIRVLGVDAPVFVAMTSRCGQMLSDTALLRAQRELANDSLNIYNGPNTDIMGDEYRYDQCHFNGIGLKTHALLWAESISGF